MERRRQACYYCTTRKLKCDRFIPCGTCVKRGLEADCIKSSAQVLTQGAIIDSKDDTVNILPLWQSYEHWVINIGLLKTKNLSLSKKKVNLEQDLNAAEFWMNYLRQENSFELLNYSIENLGPLYFSSVGDINDLFVALEDYWKRRIEYERKGEGSYTPQDYYWDTLLWAIFTLTIYYIPTDKLNEILAPESLCVWLEIPEQNIWSDTLQMTAYQGFLKCCLVTLNRTNFMMYPNVKLIQTLLVLYNTTLGYEYPALTNNLIVQSIHIAKMFNYTNYKLYNSDNTAIGLTKQIFSKMWYKLCIIDYLQSSPDKCVECHTELPSLFQSSSIYNNEGSNVYQSKDSFELLCWKFISIDRDIEKTSNSLQRPLLKTLDAAKRELEKLNPSPYKDLNKNEKRTTNFNFEYFILKFLWFSVRWKIEKLCLIYFQTADAFETLMHYTEAIIRLLVDNVTKDTMFFNKYPHIINVVSRMIGFLTFYQIFESRPDLEQIIEDLKELVTVLPVILGDTVNKLTFIVSRLEAMRVLWDKVQVINSKKGVLHPIFRIIQNDILLFSKQKYKIPPLITGVNDFGDDIISTDLESANIYMQEELDDEDLDSEENEMFKRIITTFQQENNIFDITK